MSLLSSLYKKKRITLFLSGNRRLSLAKRKIPITGKRYYPHGLDRFNIVKMLVLPRVLWRFSTISIIIPTGFLM